MKSMQKNTLAAVISASIAVFGVTPAATTADKAAQLGNSLTPVGAEKAGNADGSIPAWDGGITSAPAGYQPGMFHPDPFAGDAPTLQITPANYGEYADLLSEGHKAMFAKYKTFRMDIYPTRRSASFPQRIYDATKVNATQCTLVADGEGLRNCVAGIPFPIPNDAYEVMWNHKYRYQGVHAKYYNNQAAVTAGGSYNMVRMTEDVLSLTQLPDQNTDKLNNIQLYFKQEVLGPARLAGYALLVHETLNAQAQPRQAWVYNQGQRRVRRAPNVAYDNPGTASDGLRTNDMSPGLFNGATDRYEWKLVGKKEMYVPYNAYKAHSDKAKLEDLVRPGHINPDYLRYEKHRIWVLDARLKPGMRHINARRTFYFDEDSWMLLMVDHYDGQGNLWRFSEADPINHYELPALATTVESHYDLKSGRYISVQLDNEEQHPRHVSDEAEVTAANFSPQTLRTTGVR